ncbi:MAG: hypothetical protein Q9225_004526 [Loekoesia sp. 1 TL-2023]
MNTLQRMTYAIRRGLDYGCQHAIDFYQPVTRKYRKVNFPFPDQQLDYIRHPPTVEPIDTVTVWKGLTLSDCDTLISMQNFLKVCLEQLLEEQFTSFQARLLSNWRSSSQDGSKRPDRTETLVSHRFLFKRAQLIQAMSEALDTAAEPHSPDDDRRIKELLMLYLWSQDCMVDLPHESGQTAINTRLRCYIDSTAFFPPLSAVEAVWTPDYLTFERLDVLPQEGSEVIIKPHYKTNAPQGPGGPHTQVTYSLESSHPWLHWDDEAGAFRGRLPYLSQNPDVTGLGQVYRLGKQGSYAIIHVVRVEVKAFVVVGYPGSTVRLERTIRVRVTLRVLPPLSVLGPMTFSPYPSQSHNMCLDSDKVESYASSQPQDQHGQNSEASKNPQVDADPTPITIANQSDQVKLLNWDIFDNERGLQCRLDSHDTNADVPYLPAESQTLRPRSPALEVGLKSRPNGYSPPSAGRKKRSHKQRVFSNIPGVNLQALSVIESQRDEPVLKEATPIFSTEEEETNGLTAKENRYDAAAEAFNAKYSPRSPKKWNRTRRCVDVNTSPKASKSESLKSPACGLQSQCFQSHSQTLHNRGIPSQMDGHGSDTTRHINTMPSPHKRNIRSASSLHASMKRRQERHSKISKLEENLEITQELSGQDLQQCSTRVASSSHSPSCRGSAVKRHKHPSLTPTKNSTLIQNMVGKDSAPPSTPVLADVDTTPQTITLFNRYAPLRDLCQDSGVEPSSNDSNFQTMLAPTQLRRPRRTHRKVDSACYLEDVFQDHTREIPDSGQPDMTSQQAHPIKLYSGRRSERPEPQESSSTDPSTVSRSTVRLADVSSSLDTGFSLSPSPPDSRINSCYDDGGGPYTSRDTRAMLKISSTKEAVEAYREPGLSSDERVQKFEAMKRSLETESRSRVTSGTVGTEVSFEDEDTDETESEEDSEEEI